MQPGVPPPPGRKTQPVLEEKLKALEEECRRRESERVSLELELTEVKESLRKALAGGITLGLAIEPRSGTSSPQVTPPAAARAPRAQRTPVPPLLPVPSRTGTPRHSTRPLGTLPRGAVPPH